MMDRTLQANSIYIYFSGYLKKGILQYHVQNAFSLIFSYAVSLEASSRTHN